MVKPTFWLLLLFSISSFVALGQREERKIGCWVGFDGHLNWLADSLNFISDAEDLPKFLNDPLFDWKMKDVIWGCQTDVNSDGFSARQAVFRRVTNEKALRWIIESKNPNYDKLYNPEEEEKQQTTLQIDNSYPILPYMVFSTRQLAKRRLDEIERIKKQFKKK